MFGIAAALSIGSSGTGAMATESTTTSVGISSDVGDGPGAGVVAGASAIGSTG
jgi:hypothetical protein